MTFSNPAAGAKDAAAAYVKALLDLLGTRDPFDVMEELEGAVRGMVAGVPEARLRVAEAPGKWSMLQVVGHLVDTEIVYGYRVRLVLAEEQPVVPGYDQDRWASAGEARAAAGTARLEELLDDLGYLRRMNLRLYRGLGAGEMERWGEHSERGAESVQKMLRLLAAHDLVHRRQLQRIRSAVM